MEARLFGRDIDDVIIKMASGLDTIPESVEQGVKHSPPVDPSYIDPPILCTDDDLKHRVMVIDAPAAMGKSSLSARLAQGAQGIVIDLSAFKVGDFFIVGTLGSAFGEDNYSTIYKGLISGEVALILDSLDEAFLRSGWTGMERLAKQIGDLSTKSAGDKLRIVALGRPDAADYFALMLTDAGVQPGRARLSYLPRQSAIDVVNAGLQYIGKRPLNPESPLVVDARNAVFNAVDSLADAESRLLGGYPPFLTALVRYLHSNRAHLHEIPAQLEQSSRGDFWSFLANDVLESIFARESDRVRTWLEEELAGDGPPSYSAADCYPTDLQLRGILDPEVAVQAVMPVWTPAARLTELEARLRAFVDEHPLRGASQKSLGFGNSVFADYAIAHGLRKPQDPLAQELLAVPNLDLYAPGEALVRFMAEQGSDTSLPGRALALVVNSLSSSLVREPENNRVTVQGDGDEVEVSLVGGLLGRSLDDRVFSFKADGEIHLRGLLHNVVVDTPDLVVRLGGPGSDVVLSGICHVSSEAIVVAADVLDVATDSVVSLECELFEPSVASVPKAQFEQLRIWTDAALGFPWHRYRREPIDQSLSTDVLTRAAIDVRTLLKWWQHGAYPKKAFDTAVARQRMPGELLELLKAELIVEPSGFLYVIDYDKLGASHLQVENAVIPREGTYRRLLDKYAKMLST